MTLQQEIEQKLRNNDKIDKRTAEDLCRQHGVQYSIGIVKESIEISLMHMARELAVSLPFREAYKAIRDLYVRQPKVGEMTSRQMALQQYSTSLPVAFLMSAYVSEYNNRNSLYLEPSAGNGFLTIALPAEQTICNEIDPLRLENLMNESYRKVIFQDGRIPLPFDRIFDGVVSNPPFLKTAETNKMIFNALDCMKNDGRAAILRDKWNSFKPYFGVMQRSELNPFFDELFAEYNVVKIINLKSTEVYSKQGAVTPMQIILIDGRRPHKEPNSIYRVMNPDIDIVEPQGFDGLLYHFSQAMNKGTNEPKLQIAEMKLMRKDYKQNK